MSAKDRGPRPKPDENAELLTDLRGAFRWRHNRVDTVSAADVTGWWADAGLLQRLGPALAALLDDARPDVILGPQSRGCLAPWSPYTARSTCLPR